MRTSFSRLDHEFNLRLQIAPQQTINQLKMPRQCLIQSKALLTMCPFHYDALCMITKMIMILKWLHWTVWVTQTIMITVWIVCKMLVVTTLPARFSITLEGECQVVWCCPISSWRAPVANAGTPPERRMPNHWCFTYFYSLAYVVLFVVWNVFITITQNRMNIYFSKHVGDRV